MTFIPIELDEYADSFLKNNPKEKREEVVARLKGALERYKAGAGCQHCGAPIWVIGSAEAGNGCFSCITGEADPSEDYEIREACDKTPWSSDTGGDESYLFDEDA